MPVLVCVPDSGVCAVRYMWITSGQDPDVGRVVRNARSAATERIPAAASKRHHAKSSTIHQMTRWCLFQTSSAIYSCPLAMTVEAARVLQLIANDALKSRAFARLAAPDIKEIRASGQCMTERTGGRCGQESVGGGFRRTRRRMAMVHVAVSRAEAARRWCRKPRAVRLSTNNAVLSAAALALG